jgi:hypothetical protein
MRGIPVAVTMAVTMAVVVAANQGFSANRSPRNAS